MGKNAFVFPGQGSQSVGMLKELADQFSVVNEKFEEASSALNYDLWELIQNDDGRLNQTHITQPALLTASVAAWEVYKSEKKPEVDLFAGHSLGEYSALTCAGVFSLSEAVSLVEARGKYMQQAVSDGSGAMFAIIGLANELVIQTCEQVAKEMNRIVSPVNFNSPVQIVIAGEKDAVEKAAEACKSAGAKRALPLAVSVPSHCALMKPAAQQLSERLNNIEMQAPNIRVLNNVDVSVETDIASIKDALVRQLYMPVRWTESVVFMSENGITNITEIGPGKVLTGLNKRINKALSLANFSSPSDL